MITERDVKNGLAALVDQRQSIQKFRDWLETASWNMHADSSPDTIDLVSSIHLLFSEYDHGDLTESELRRELMVLVNDPVALFIRIEVDDIVSVRTMAARASQFTSTAWADVEARVPA